jgi:cytochrome c556
MTDTTAPVPTNTQLAEAAAQALLPLAGPYGVLADQVLTAGLAFWANFQSQKAAGTLTMADLEAAAAKTSTDLAQLTADVAAQQP